MKRVKKGFLLHFRKSHNFSWNLKSKAAAAVKYHSVVLFVFPQVTQFGKLFTSHRTSTQRMRRLVSTRMFAFVVRTMWPTTTLRCSLNSRATPQRPRRWLPTPSRPFTPSWPWWTRPRRGTRSRWSLWRASSLYGTWCGSRGCSPAAPRSHSSVSARRTIRVSPGHNTSVQLSHLWPQHNLCDSVRRVHRELNFREKIYIWPVISKQVEIFRGVFALKAEGVTVMKQKQSFTQRPDTECAVYQRWKWRRPFDCGRPSQGGFSSLSDSANSTSDSLCLTG